MEVLEDRCLLSFNPIGPDFLIAGGLSPSTNLFPAVGMDSLGGFVVGWQSLGIDPSASGIRIQQFAADGAEVAPPFVPSLIGSALQSFPSIAVADDGSFVIAWQQLGDIYARQFDAAGNVQGGVIQVSVGARFDVGARLAMDASGDFAIVWEATGGGTSDAIFGRRYSAAGVALGGEFRVDAMDGTRAMDAAIAMDADGDFVVVWTSFERGGIGGFENSGIYARRYSAIGAIMDDAPLLVSDSRADLVSRASVAMDDQGNFVVAWQADLTGSSYDIYAKRFAPTGTAVAPTFLVNTFTTGRQQNVSVASTAAGEIVFTWDGESALADQSINGRRFSSAGAPLGSEFAVATSDEFSFQPSIAINNEGDFVVSWTTFSGIYARIYHENRAPTAVPIPTFRAAEDSVLSAGFDLSQFFADQEEGATGLSYSIQSISDASGLLSSQVLTRELLTLQWSANAFGTARILVRATDSDGKFVDSEIVLQIDPVNDLPTMTLPVDLTTNFGANLLIPDLRIDDIDIADGLMTVSLTANGGLLSIGNPGTLQFLVGTGSNDRSMSIRGTLQQLNGALATLSFIPAQAGVLADITVEVDDLFPSDRAVPTIGTFTVAVRADSGLPDPPPSVVSPPTSIAPVITTTPILFQPFLLSTIFVRPTPVPVADGSVFGSLIPGEGLDIFTGNENTRSAAERSRDSRSTASGQMGFLEVADPAASSGDGESTGWDLASKIALAPAAAGAASLEMRSSRIPVGVERMVNFWEGPGGLLNSALAEGDDSVPLIERLLAGPESKGGAATTPDLEGNGSSIRALSSLLHLEGLLLSPLIDLALGVSAAWNTLAVDFALSDRPTANAEIVEEALGLSSVSEIQVAEENGESGMPTIAVAAGAVGLASLSYVGRSRLLRQKRRRSRNKT